MAAHHPSTTAPSPSVHPHLAEHAALYERRVEQVTERVFVAIGFGLANTVMIVGDDGLIVVDTMESVDAATEARDALRAHSTLPVKAIIYTHGHPDHVWGTRAWVPEGAEDQVEIIAHATVPHYVNEFANVLAPRYSWGGLHMYGGLLPDAEHGFVVNGIGPRVRAAERRGYLPPTRTFTERLDTEIAGVRLTLEFGPGESPDEIFVWLPDDGVLLSADTVYKSYPNVYTIRGARFRDPRDWYGTIDKMRAHRPDHLVPCHGPPVSGADEVMRILTVYRDGIQYVFDQTVRAMNRGLTPGEIAAEVALPPALADEPYLRQLYGMVEFCAREVYAGLYGWFSGDPGDLHPPPPAEEAAEIVALAGGFDQALSALRTAVDDGRLRWAARLASHLLLVDADHTETRELAAAALRQLAYDTSNANARNWWLTSAAVLDGSLAIDPSFGLALARMQMSGLLGGVPATDTIAALPARLDPDKAGETSTSILMRVPDDGCDVLLAIRNGVCAIEPLGVDDVDVSVTISKADLVELVVGRLTWADAVASSRVDVDGSVDDLLRITSLFDGWDA